MVIVLLSILSMASIKFVSDASIGAIATGDRQQRAITASVISEQLTRRLRNALPASIRVTPNGAASNSCR